MPAILGTSSTQLQANQIQSHIWILQVDLDVSSAVISMIVMGDLSRKVKTKPGTWFGQKKYRN